MQLRAYEHERDAVEVQPASDPLKDDPSRRDRLTVPILAAAGEHDMPDLHAGAEWLKEVLPSARAIVIKGAGHLAPMETP